MPAFMDLNDLKYQSQEVIEDNIIYQLLRKQAQLGIALKAVAAVAVSLTCSIYT